MTLEQVLAQSQALIGDVDIGESLLITFCLINFHSVIAQIKNL
jgi:hypothetical protein